MAREGYIDTTSDTDTAAPIGCSKMDAHADSKFTNAAIASGSARRTPSSRASRSMPSGRRRRCVLMARAYLRRRA